MTSARIRTVAAAFLITGAAAVSAGAQKPPVPPGVPDVGQMAPDFVMPGATRYGVLRDPVRLSDFRGQTVVLAFFIRARTKG
jgi:peroxiredoxin Q/BCP